MLATFMELFLVWREIAANFSFMNTVDRQNEGNSAYAVKYSNSCLTLKIFRCARN